MFISYPKIHRLGKEETDGILDFESILQEKIDGANTSIWLDGGELHLASRTREITDGFNGFVDYVKENKEINKLLADHPEYRLFGEWLVRHTISYNETAYRKFYLFDIMDGDEFIETTKVDEIAENYNIPHPRIFSVGKHNEADIAEYVGKTELGAVGEGVVIKTRDFINKFGDIQYAKVVTQKFKEDNAITFGGNNKHSETYWEMYVVNKYATLPRVEKIMNKIQPTVDHKLDLPDIPRITGTCYHDMLTEEIWEISKKVHSLDFKQLKRLAIKKFVQIYKDVILGDVSVADRDNR
jgi:hypothetical protein